MGRSFQAECERSGPRSAPHPDQEPSTTAPPSERSPLSVGRAPTVWRGGPREIVTPAIWRAVAILSFGMALVSVCFAIVVAQTLAIAPTSSLLFAAWTASLGLAAWYGPRIWLSKVEYLVTRDAVIVKRGPFRRSIGRDAISFVRIAWSSRTPGVGDLELVRAVPTGALRRRLRLRLAGLSAPARVAAIINGVEGITPAADAGRFEQRLQTGERVVWSGRPRPSLRAYLPHGQRQWGLTLLAGFLLAVLVRMAWRGARLIDGLLSSGMPATSLSFVALAIGMLLAGTIVAAGAAYCIYDGIVLPGRLVRDTRYLVTNRRVLIQRGREELQLSRDKIVDVIDAPTGDGFFDVFLVLDGPQARALAASGAFGEGERGPALRPVLERVEDVEGVRRILREPAEPDLPRAA